MPKRSLTDKQIRNILILSDQGYRVRDIRRFTLHAPSTIYKVISGEYSGMPRGAAKKIPSDVQKKKL